MTILIGHVFALCFIMPPPLIGGGIKRWCYLTSVWRLTSVCLTSVAYIGPKSRTERPRKTKIGTKVACAHHTWLGHHFRGQKVKVTRPFYSPPCWRISQLQRWGWERAGGRKLLLRCRLLGGARRFGAHVGRRRARAYRGGRPPTACSFLLSANVSEERSLKTNGEAGRGLGPVSHNMTRSRATFCDLPVLCTPAAVNESTWTTHVTQASLYWPVTVWVTACLGWQHFVSVALAYIRHLELRDRWK